MKRSFDEMVWGKCREIPRGKLSTYKHIAEGIGKPNAARAVGGALNRNPFAPQVPCHRVVGSDGRLRGFACGLRVKKRLLKKEGIPIKGNRVENLESFLV